MVVLAGIAGNICVLFTANDAYLRDLRLLVPSDCVVSNSEAENHHALEQMRTILKADIRPSTEIDFESLKQADDLCD
jgi:nicotinamidase-related amidase